MEQKLELIHFLITLQSVPTLSPVAALRGVSRGGDEAPSLPLRQSWGASRDGVGAAASSLGHAARCVLHLHLSTAGCLSWSRMAPGLGECNC